MKACGHVLRTWFSLTGNNNCLIDVHQFNTLYDEAFGKLFDVSHWHGIKSALSHSQKFLTQTHSADHAVFLHDDDIIKVMEVVIHICCWWISCFWILLVGSN